MKLISAGLMDNVVSSYDQTKTTIQGRTSQKTISGKSVLGAPLTNFIDVFTDSGLTPVGTMYISPNGRMFIIGAVAAGAITIGLYEFDFVTGNRTYVGKIIITTPNNAATTHTVRGLRVIDTGTTGWRIVLTTIASVLINGGTFIVNNIDKVDFSQFAPPTIPFATGNAQKAVYFVQNPAAIGVGQLETAAAGVIFDIATGKHYTHNGIAATHQYYVRDYTAALTYTTTAVSVNVATPGVVTHAGHTFIANDPVVFTAGTLPTGLVVGTVYYVRNPVAGVSYELSLLTAGVSINTTGSPSTGAFIGRAFGTIGDTFLFKTGNLPALTGTLLLTDSEAKAVPVSSPLNGPTLNGNSCAFFASSTNLYLGLLSELTSGVTTWPSLTSSNLLGATNEVTAPTTVQAGWSNVLDRAIFLTNTTRFMTKQLENNVIKSNFGELNNKYYEGNTFDAITLGLITVINLTNENGWLFVMGSTVGQRGVIYMDLRSDQVYDYSYIVTKVLNMPNAQLRSLSTFRKLVPPTTGAPKIQYRTSGFGSITGGWLDAPTNEDEFGTITTTGQIQFKILNNQQSVGSYTGPQMYDLLVGYSSNSEISDNWEYSHDNSSSASPTRVGFRLKKAYTSTVPTIYFRSYDLSDSLLINQNTVTDAANFEYSTNDGASWLPLGTIPNTVGTLIRYNFVSPPGVKIRPSVRES